MPQPNSIHMGHGQMVDIVERGADQWELVFSQDGHANYQAPPIADIKVEAIDGDGAIHALAIAKGDNRDTVLASGRVAGAYRARVMVMHGDHFHTRESLLPGQSSVAPKQGAHGGSIVQFSSAIVEAKLVAPDTFELQFASSPPAPESVVMQAIGPKAENYQIRNLAMRAGDTPGTLIASGKIKDAAFLRLTLKNGASAEVRSVPVVREGGGVAAP